MPAYIDQSFEEFPHRIHIGNLPVDVNARHITDIFGKFGVIVKLYLKRRASKDSPTLLVNPFVILIYERRESIDKIMKQRPYFMNDCQLFVRRCIPLTRRYPYEPYMTTTKVLIRIPEENHQEILPNDNQIFEYLKSIGSQILRLERFEEKTIFVEFEDYDTVDLCCLARPHYINNQLIEIEKCADEHQARRRAQFREQARSRSLLKHSSNTTVNDVDTQSGNTISPTLTFNNDEQAAQLRLLYSEKTRRLEEEHEQLLSSLKSEWKQIAKERIRLQRLTLDYREEQHRLIKQNRRWNKMYKESLQEQSSVQNEGQQKLFETKEKYLKIKQNYDQLILDSNQQTE